MRDALATLRRPQRPSVRVRAAPRRDRFLMAFLDDVIADLDAYQRAHPWRSKFWSAWRRLKRAPHDSYWGVRWAWQRVHRGWDDRSIWSLDTWLARTLGAQLQ